MTGQDPLSLDGEARSAETDAKPSFYERIALFVLAYLTLGGMAVGLITATGLVFDLAAWLWLPLDVLVAVVAIPALWLMLRPASGPQAGPTG
ncbi:MAG: hypothetical protein RLO50_18505 [Azospirillaceae bacterium]